MLKPWQLYGLVGLSGLACLLVLANMVLFSLNRSQQQAVTGRQQFIQQSLQLEPLYQQLVKGLADLATRNNDEQLRAVLASQGITVARGPSPAPAASAPTAPAKR